MSPGISFVYAGIVAVSLLSPPAHATPVGPVPVRPERVGPAADRTSGSADREADYAQMMALHDQLSTELALLARQQALHVDLRRIADGILRDAALDEAELDEARAQMSGAGRAGATEALDDPVTEGLLVYVRSLDGRAFDLFMTTTLLAEEEAAVQASVKTPLLTPALKAYAQRSASRAARAVRELRLLRKSLEAARNPS